MVQLGDEENQALLADSDSLVGIVEGLGCLHDLIICALRVQVGLIYAPLRSS